MICELRLAFFFEVDPWAFEIYLPGAWVFLVRAEASAQLSHQQFPLAVWVSVELVGVLAQLSKQ